MAFTFDNMYFSFHFVIVYRPSQKGNIFFKKYSCIVSLTNDIHFHLHYTHYSIFFLICIFDSSWIMENFFDSKKGFCWIVPFKYFLNKKKWSEIFESVHKSQYGKWYPLKIYCRNNYCYCKLFWKINLKWNLYLHGDIKPTNFFAVPTKY